MAIVDGFKHSISRVGWTLTLVDTYFPDFGDSVAGHATFYLGVHKFTGLNVQPIHLHHPPARYVASLETFIYKPLTSANLQSTLHDSALLSRLHV